MNLLVLSSAATNSALTSLPLFSKGLVTTVIGLLGVFLVLTLFYVTIKLMQRIGAKQDDQKEA